MALIGCASRRSYRSLPAHLTQLRFSSLSEETYLVEVIPAFSDSFALRFDFAVQGDEAKVSIAKLGYAGVTETFERSGVVAADLLRSFRRFDWNAAAASEATDDGLLRLAPDDTIVAVKAQVHGIYREFRCGTAASPQMEAFVRSVLRIAEKPNQALEPTTLLVTPRADARVAPSRVVAHL